MAITDIQISEELETSAPSIKYSGNEGPKSPQEEQMMMADAILEEEYNKYVFDLLEIRPEATPMTIEEFRQMVIAEGQMSGGQPLPQDPTKPVNPFQPKPTGPVLPDRQMAAYGGIMGMDGRKRYGLGSIKDRLRKLIPNEIAKVAEVAAPFVAPFNPLAAGLMSGIGGFDRTGRIGSSLKSGLMNYGLGQVARGIGGADLQQGFNLKINPNATGLGQYFSSPMAAASAATKTVPKQALTSQGDYTLAGKKVSEMASPNFLERTMSKIGEFVPTSFSDLKDPKKILGALGIYQVGKELLGGPEEVVSEIMDRGEGLDIQGIRAEVTEAFKDPSGKKLAALRTKYPYLGTQASKNTAIMANGGRIGMAEGGIMDLGGMEKDYRNTGGFVDIGEYEKKDDVPARLSVNEFVMTADAVRGMGDGDIDLGAKRMENLMGAMENKKGAQQMFDVSERLSEVV